MSKIPPPPPVAKKKLPAKKKPKHEIVLPSKMGRTRTAIFKVYNTYIRTQGVSIEWCWHNTLMTDDPAGPKAKDWVGIDALHQHAKEENWKGVRDDMWADVRKQVSAAAKMEIVEAELAEMGELTKLQTRLTTEMQDESLKPTSLDAAIRTAIALDKRIGEKRGFVATHVSSLTPPEKPEEAAKGLLVAPDVGDELEEAELRKFAIQVSASRAGMNSEPESTNGIERTDDADPHGEE